MHLFFDENTKKETMFPDFFSLYLDKFDSKFNVSNNEYNDVNFNGVYKYIYTKIFSYSIRALIRELYNYKKKNLLLGETPRERFTSFEEITKTSNFIKKFHKKYPILNSCLEQVITQTALYVCEIIDNFKKDKYIIEKIFKIKCEKILDIHLGKGDTHNGGRSVAIVDFNSGKVVYKPHSLSTDVIFENIITWINSKNILKSKLNSLKVIDYNNYGWQEFIKYSECKNYTQVKNYYYRAGCFLAIFYTLGTNDIHYENVIVDQEYPYFIDLETLIGNNNSNQVESVLTTSFIPNRYINTLFDIDISGLCGKSQVSSKLTTIKIVNPKTDEMKIETHPAGIYSNNNLVKLQGKIIKIEDYSEIFISGFQDTIDLIIDNKDSYLKCIKGQLNRSQKFRKVIRNTHVYAKFLIAASHPDYLESELKRTELFQKLYNGCKNELDRNRISNEISNLLKWDIPYYYCYYNSKDLFSDNTVICKNYFESTIKESLYKRIKKIDSKVEKFQIDVIRKSLFTAYEDKFMKKQFNKINLCSNNNNLHTDVIMDIADSISSNILESKNSNQVAFLINVLRGDKVILSPMNFNLYEGGGIIWLFTCLGEFYNNNYYKSISVKLLESSILAYKYEMKQNNYQKISAFWGIGSLMYLYYNMYVLYNSEDYYTKFIDIAKKVLEYDSDYLVKTNYSVYYDFVCGISGIVVLAARIYFNERNDLMQKIINKYSNYLLWYINKSNLDKIGLAHGISGYSLALIMIYLVKNDNKYLDLAIDLINKEDSLYLNNLTMNKIKTSWCNGETGMLLVRNELFKITHSRKILKYIFKYLQTVVINGFYNINSMCLCHGTYGNIEIVKKVIDDINEAKKIVTYDSIKKFEGKLVNNLDDIQLGLKNNFMMDTFMIGSSGIAYSKLRYLYPKLPSILCLDILDNKSML